MHTTDTMRPEHVPKFAERERLSRRFTKMPCIIFGPYVPKAVQSLVERGLFPDAACEIVRHDDPRLTTALCPPQSVWGAKGSGIDPRPVKVPKDESGFGCDLFVHVNYFGIDGGKLVITVWERGSAPPAE